MKANFYLNFDGTTEDAFAFYRSIFGGEYLGVLRFRDFGGEAMGATGSDLDKIAHIALPLGDGNLLMGTDVIASMPMTLTVGNNFSIMLETETADEADRLYGALSGGGAVVMPLEPVAWAEAYGEVVDRFGVRWIINYTGDVEFGAGPQG
jgi:PhnB protein